MKKLLCLLLIFYSTFVAGCAALPAEKVPAAQTSAPDGLTQAPGSSPLVTVAPNGSFSLVGSGRMTTAPIPIKPGTLKLTWRYQGSPGEMTRVSAAQANHLYALDSLSRNHQSLVSAINQDMKTDLLDGDPNGFNQNQQVLDQENNGYEQAVMAENTRYQTEIAGLTTPFIVKVSRKSKEQPVTLITARGIYQGSVNYNAQDAPDYYFIIQASGPFQIDVTR